MTPSWGDSGFSLEPTSREERKPTWPRVAVLAGILLFALFVAKGCQDSQVDITQEKAVAIANANVDFTPTYTQVRLLRQGINRRAFWFVSLSIPIGFSGDRPDLFAALSVVEIDAGSGKITKITSQSPEETAKMKREAARRDDDAAVREKLRESGNP